MQGSVAHRVSTLSQGDDSFTHTTAPFADDAFMDSAVRRSCDTGDVSKYTPPPFRMPLMVTPWIDSEHSGRDQMTIFVSMVVKS